MAFGTMIMYFIFYLIPSIYFSCLALKSGENFGYYWTGFFSIFRNKSIEECSSLNSSVLYPNTLKGRKHKSTDLSDIRKSPIHAPSLSSSTDEGIYV